MSHMGENKSLLLSFHLMQNDFYFYWVAYLFNLSAFLFLSGLFRAAALSCLVTGIGSPTIH